MAIPPCDTNSAYKISNYKISNDNPIQINPYTPVWEWGWWGLGQMEMIAFLRELLMHTPGLYT